MLPRIALATALLAVALAGCSSDETLGTDATVPTGPDGLAAPAAADGSAPVWKVGQWWDHKWFFGSTATEPFTVKTIVAEDRGVGWFVATDESLTSAFHAAFIFPTLGEFPKGHVTATAGDHQWPWYQFPLADNQTWRTEVRTRDDSGGTYGFPLEVSVRAAPGIVTAIGVEDGFALEARTVGGDGIPAGRLFARYDYVPALGWMSQCTFYDVLAEEDEVPQFILETSATGTGYSGPYFDTAGDVLSTHFNLIVPMAPAPPNPSSSFTVTAEHTHVMAFLFDFAAAGAHSTALAAPDGRHWQSFSTGDPDGNPIVSSRSEESLVFVPAAPGDWHVATVGAGAFVAGGGLLAYGITQRQAQL
jgi:hypothetical protein